LSYAAQQAAGLGTTFRDTRHVEKAFVFGGMPARNGVLAAELVAAGFTGVEDVLDGDRNFFHRFRGEADRLALTDGLGTRYAIASTNIKKYSVGSPNQTVLQAVESLIARGLTATDVASMTIEVPEYVLDIVDSVMPDISARYLAASTLLDGAYSFAAAHDYHRMHSPQVQELLGRMTLAPLEVTGRSRAARVVVQHVDGRTLDARAEAARGSIHDPMTREEVQEKALSLLATVLPGDAARRLVQRVFEGDPGDPVSDLTALLSTRTSA
jgi:2-methylcitrate dehydratase PrpD